MDDLLPMVATRKKTTEDSMKAKEYFDKIDRRKEATAKILESMKKSDKPFLMVFLIDATSSMGDYMATARQVVTSLVKTLDEQMPGCVLNLLAVLYRDPLEGKEGALENSHVTFMTSDEKVFREKLNNQRAMGGGDVAEDVAGGFELLNNAIQDLDKNQLLRVFHILDAPAHGFCDGLHSDYHDTNEQRERLRQAINAFTGLMQQFQEPEYHYFGVSTIDSLEAFKTNMRNMIASNLPHGSDIYRIFKWCNPTQDFSGTLAASTFASVTATSKLPDLDDEFALGLTKNSCKDDFEKYGLNYYGDDDEKNTTHPYPTESNIVIFGASLKNIQIPSNPVAFTKSLNEYVAPPKISLDEVFTAKWNWWSQFHKANGKRKVATLETDDKEENNTLCFIESKTLARGTENVAVHAQIFTGLDDDTMAKVKGMTRSAWVKDSIPEVSESCVVKFHLARQQNLSQQLELTVVLQFLANKFKALTEEHRLRFVNITILSPSVLQLTSNSSVMSKGKSVFISPRRTAKFDYSLLVEKSLLPYSAKFTKWMNNAGIRCSTHMDPDLEPKKYIEETCALDAFTLYVWRFTRGNMVPSDYQGKFVKKDEFERLGKSLDSAFLLTDGAISAKNIDCFGITNLGPVAVHEIAAKAYDTFTKAMPDEFEKFVAAMGIDAKDFDSI